VCARKKVITKLLELTYPFHDGFVAVIFMKYGYYGQVASKVPPGARILEVGSGTGRMLQTLCGRAYGVGLDISKKFLLIAKERLKRCPFDLVLGTATNLPFRSDAFDAVVTFTMVHHLTDKEKDEMLEEIKKVSKLYLFGELDKSWCWTVLLLRLIGGKSVMRKEKLEEHGFVVEEWRDMGGFCLVAGKARRT